MDALRVRREHRPEPWLMPTRWFTINGRQVIDPRSTAAWRRLVARVITEEPHCWLQLDGCTGASNTGDHVIAVTDRPDLALVRANVHGACASCNSRRGNLPIEALILGSNDGPAAALSIFDRSIKSSSSGSD
jgi:5-methylcytosine-specific restriction endonuclease McrA